MRDLIYLTQAQERVLGYVEKCIDNGLPPTYAEISKRFGWKSPNAAVEHLKALERKGCIKLLEGKKRGIKLVKA